MFQAKYDGVCIKCGWPIKEGDWIHHKKGDGAWHKDCGEINIFKVCKEGSFTDFLKLIDRYGINFCFKNYSVLMAASFFSRADIVSYLMNRGANIYAKNYKGETAIDLASNYEVKNLLLGINKKKNTRVVDSSNYVWVVEEMNTSGVWKVKEIFKTRDQARDFSRDYSYRRVKKYKGYEF